MATSQEFMDLMEQIDDLWSWSAEGVALCEEAVRMADELQDQMGGYQARRQLMSHAQGAGMSEKMLTAFSWCRSFLDKNPEAFGDEYEGEVNDLLWHQRWATNAARTFPQISRARTEELHADYARRMREMGLSGHNAAFCGLLYEMGRGDKAAAAAHFEVWNSTGRDHLSACEACEADTLADYYFFLGDDEAGLKEVERIINSGLTCAHIPTVTHTTVIIPLMKLGRWDEAAQHAAASRQNVVSDNDHLPSQGIHLIYLALTNLSAACKWYAHHLDWAEKSKELSASMNFHKYAAAFFGKLLKEGHETVKLKLPRGVKNWQESGEYDCTERQKYHLEVAREIAKRFDERDGTSARQDEIEEALKLIDLAPSQSNGQG